jgi:hypothetical protein
MNDTDHSGFIFDFDEFERYAQKLSLDEKLNYLNSVFMIIGNADAEGKSIPISFREKFIDFVRMTVAAVRVSADYAPSNISEDTKLRFIKLGEKIDSISVSRIAKRGEHPKKKNKEEAKIFTFDEIVDHCDELQDINLQLTYLKLTLKDYQNWIDAEGLGNQRHLDEKLDIKLIPKLEREIEHREQQLIRQAQPITGNNRKPQKEIEKFDWTHDLTLLTDLGELLIEKGYIAKPQRHKINLLITNHFDVRGETPRNVKQIRANKKNYNQSGKSRDYKELTQTIEVWENKNKK